MNGDTSYLKFNYKSVRHFGHVEVRHVHAIDIKSKPRTEITQKQIAFYDRLHNSNLHAENGPLSYSAGFPNFQLDEMPRFLEFYASLLFHFVKFREI